MYTSSSIVIGIGGAVKLTLELLAIEVPSVKKKIEVRTILTQIYTIHIARNTEYIYIYYVGKGIQYGTDEMVVITKGEIP